MKLVEFELYKREFQEANTEKKVNMYIEAQGLTQEQYRELLKLFPYHEIHKLEAALA